MVCTAKHTQYQPNETWRCPKCGAKAEGDGFLLESSADGVSDEYDECVCHICGYHAYGKTVANRLKKLDNMVICPTCKGKSVVPNTYEDEVPGLIELLKKLTPEIEMRVAELEMLPLSTETDKLVNNARDLLYNIYHYTDKYIHKRK